jgi:hypothetical protein
MTQAKSQVPYSVALDKVVDYLSVPLKLLVRQTKPLSEMPGFTLGQQPNLKIMKENSITEINIFTQDLVPENLSLQENIRKDVLARIDKAFSQSLRDKSELLNSIKRNVMSSYFSHSAFSTLVKTQVGNGNLPDKIVGGYNACQWLRDNSKHFDTITQREVVRTGLIGKCQQFGPTDIYEWNILKDNETYLFSQPEKCGTITFYTDNEDLSIVNHSRKILNSAEKKNKELLAILSECVDKASLSKETFEQIKEAYLEKEDDTSLYPQDDTLSIYFTIDIDVTGISRLEII